MGEPLPRRDDLHDRTFTFEPWQFFVLEVLPGCETFEKLQSVFQDRFGHAVTREELEMLFASLADRKLFDASALKHPLLKPFALRTFDVVDGKAVQKSQGCSSISAVVTACTEMHSASRRASVSSRRRTSGSRWSRAAACGTKGSSIAPEISAGW